MLALVKTSSLSLTGLEPEYCDGRTGEVERSVEVAVGSFLLPAGRSALATALEILSLALVVGVVATFDVVASSPFVDCAEVFVDCMKGLIKVGLSRIGEPIDFGTGVGVFIGVVNRLLLMLPPSP